MPNPLSKRVSLTQIPRFSQRNRDVKFIRENKSPEGKSVEILVFGVYENPFLLREVHTID